MISLTLLATLATPAMAAPSADDIADSATWHLENTPNLERNDCSGLVEAIFEHAGMEFPGNTASYWSEAERWGKTRSHTPKPGDLAFFDYTYDKNGNGSVDDPLTHIAVVAAVEEDGTVVMAHKGGSGITPLRMNLDHPDIHTKGNRVLNDSLRQKGYGDPDGHRMTGQLLRGFASMTGEASSEGTDVSEGTDGPRVGSTGSVLIEALGVPARDDTPAELKARVGDRVPAGKLSDLSCEELWRVRNSVYARHGYAFDTEKARVFFGFQEWYVRNPLVTADGVDRFLTGADRRNVEKVQRAEAKAGCVI